MSQERGCVKEEIGLLCDGSSGDVAQERQVALMLQAKFREWQVCRRLNGCKLLPPRIVPCNWNPHMETHTTTPHPWPDPKTRSSDP